MTDWSDGYVADIPYSLGFYRETVPAHIAFAALAVGKHPGASLNPRRVLELGFGMGLGLVVNAAANPSTHFEGIDFNPQHVAHAQGLVEAAAIANVKLREASFQDLAREPQDEHDLDLIVLHGILTWISTDAHEAVVEIARRRLRPGGLLYASYNCMPGWAPVLPMQRLLRENAKRVAGRSDAQMQAGFDLVQALMSEGSTYFAANPGLKARVDRSIGLDRNYLAHEYLNANWHVFHFSEVAEMFGRAKLDFVCSSTLVENMDGIAIVEGMRARVAAETDPVFKETLRDLASNKQFRRDLFGRGVASTTGPEQTALLARMRFVLATPRSKVTMKMQTPLGEVEGNPQLYGALADRLAQGPASLAEIIALPAFHSGGAAAALQAVGLFVHAGQILPAPVADTIDVAPAQRLNRIIAEKVEWGHTYGFLAPPIAGTGIQTSIAELLMLNAVLRDRASSADALAQDLSARMRERGISWLANGKPLNQPSAVEERVQIETAGFLTEKLPLWRQLGIL